MIDIKSTSFWQRFPKLYPYALLARWDRPVGIWLLFWPCVWGLLLAPGFRLLYVPEQARLLGLFFVGSVAMRGAGCTINDWIDRHMDAQVARTKNRPLASGALKLWQAAVFLVLQLLVGLAVLVQLSPFAILLSLMAVPLVIAYPWMKRITYWPQLFLGVVFNAGTLIGFATLESHLTPAAGVLYVSAILWTLAYDSVYAFLDSADDAAAGVKSTVQLWAMNSKMIIGWLWFASSALFALALWLAGGYGPLAYGLVLVATVFNLAAHTYWDIANDGFTLTFFRMQSRIGLVLAMALAVPLLFS